MWDYPDLKQTPVEKYTVSYYDSNSGQQKEVNITDPQETFFIDQNYMYGFCQYMVTVHFKDNRISPINGVHTAQYTELTADNLELNLRQQYSSDGYLELLWNKPEINRMPVSRYLIEYWDEKLGGWQTIDIDNPDNTSYIDENYVYGQREYRFTVFLMGDRFKVSTKYSPTYRELTSDDLTFEDIDLENIRVSWPKPEFNCTKIIRLFDNDNFLVPEGENSFTFKREEFFSSAWEWQEINKGELYLVGKKTPYDIDVHPAVYSTVSIPGYYVHKRFNLNGSIAFSPYPAGNLLYAVTSNGLYSIDMATMQPKKLNIADDVALTIDYYYSTKVATFGDNTISIYQDHTFTNPVRSQLGSSDYKILGFTPDNKLLVTRSYSYITPPGDIPLMFFDGNTGDYLNTIFIPDHGKSVSQIKISIDKTYIIAELYKPYEENSQQTDIYKLTGNNLSLIKTLSHNDIEPKGLTIMTSPINPNHLIFSYAIGVFQVVELPGFNTIAEINGSFLAVDFVTGDLLYNKNWYLHITDPTASKEICTYEIIYGLFSYNNVLINSAGYYFDISKFIQL
jgi:Fibronectin type III domain.